MTLAVALSSIQPSIDFINDVEIDVYEASSQFTQIGTGITLWPRAWKILVEQLGLGPSLLDHLSGQQVPDDEPRKVVTRRKDVWLMMFILFIQVLRFSSEKVTKIMEFTFMTLFLLVKFKFSQVPAENLSTLNLEGVPRFIHRALIQKTFLNHLSPSIRCHLSSRLVSYDEIPQSGGSLQLVFENGNTATCDLLIGADGIKSIVRKKFVVDHHSTEYGQVPNTDPMWSGTFAYRCMVESKLIAEQMPNHRALTTPVIVSHRQWIFQRHSTNDVFIRSVLW